MFRSPTAAGLPGLSIMLDDLPATDKQIARHLGLSLATLQRYRRLDAAPRAVMLALFWETRWGRSAADCEASNAAMLATGEALALRGHVDRMAGIVWRLECELTKKGTGLAAGAYPANLPVFRVG